MVTALYDHAAGRMLLKGILHSGLTRPAAAFLRGPLSRGLIAPYIRKNRVEMREFAGQRYGSFEEFFARSRGTVQVEGGAQSLISPCDGLLTAYPVEGERFYPIKGSDYRVRDLISNEETASQFADGLCVILRLQASDYHHFCYIDSGFHGPSTTVEGMLHSVQPIACAKEPVYRLNRRRWTELVTDHFGPVAQVEVGALLVGGMSHVQEAGTMERGEEMGHFELCGSTIVLFYTKDVREKLEWKMPYHKGWMGQEEVPIRQGREFGWIRE